MSNNSGVKFENEWRPPIPPRRSPKIIQWTMRYSGGLVKDEKQANYVLLGFAVVVILVTAIIIISLFRAGNEIPPPPPTPLEEGNL